jgi:hypothetical protein
VLTDELLLHLHKPFQTNVETFQLIGHSSATISLRMAISAENPK